MWRLGLDGSGGGEENGDAALLPERLGEADCGYYLRTGGCGFGERCRYNHPRDRGGTEVSARARPPRAKPWTFSRSGAPTWRYE
jgi:hypothetical protein